MRLRLSNIKAIILNLLMVLLGMTNVYLVNDGI